jgi:hypothetical protein
LAQDLGDIAAALGQRIQEEHAMVGQRHVTPHRHVAPADQPRIRGGSDRPLSDQRHLWERHHIVVDFTALKHRLGDVKAQFPAEAYYHIGDTDTDRFLADRARFRFVMANAAVCQAWGPAVFA